MVAIPANLRVKYAPIADVRPYEDNPRHNDEAVEAVAASIREFGWKQPIVVDADGTIIVGHTRWKAAKALGMDEVPVVVASDLTPEQCAAYRLADNRVGELAEWDSELLAQELDGLAGFDMEQFGFDESDLQTPEAFEEPVSLDEVREVEPDDSAPDRVRLGELWRIGDHVLLCGDATSEADVKRLIEAGGGSADMLLTDPPYNVGLGWHMIPSEAKQLHRRTDGLVIENDNWDSDDEFEGFLREAIGNAASVIRDGAAFYIWHAHNLSEPFFRAVRECGLTVRQCLVWAKNTFALGRQDYQWRHEPCLYGWKDGAAHYFFDSRTETTVIEDAKPDPKKMTKAELVEFAQSVLTEKQASTVLEFDKPSRSEEHPTMKPVKLFAYLVRNSSRPGDLVLDPFAGSGTTVMACEQLKRRAAVMELDPHYASVIVERWERLTGKAAERVE